MGCGDVSEVSLRRSVELRSSDRGRLMCPAEASARRRKRRQVFDSVFQRNFQRVSADDEFDSVAKQRVRRRPLARCVDDEGSSE